jgi:hypothetical protein
MPPRTSSTPQSEPRVSTPPPKASPPNYNSCLSVGYVRAEMHGGSPFGGNRGSAWARLSIQNRCDVCLVATFGARNHDGSFFTHNKSRRIYSRENRGILLKITPDYPQQRISYLVMAPKFTTHRVCTMADMQNQDLSPPDVW